MKRLLMLSASIFEIPLIRAAQAQGYYVITTGNNSGAPGHTVSNEYINFDYSDYDGMVQMAKRVGVDAISQGCSDNCALVAAYMGEKLGLLGHDTLENAKIIHRKDKFKEFVAKYGIHSPIANYFNSIEGALYFEFGDNPVIVKPSDQAGGKGVSVVDNIVAYEKAVRRAFEISREGRIVVEPFIQGTLHSLSTFIVDGHIATYATLNDYSFQNKYMTNTGVSPADGWKNAIEKLLPEVEKVVEKLKLVDGLLHLQYIKSKDDYWIIEMMRRTPGNNCTTALSRASGIDWRDWIIRAEAGRDCHGIPYAKFPDRIYGYHAIMGEHNGIYQGFDVDDDFKKNIIDFEEYDSPGTIVDDYLYQKFGTVQFFFDNEMEKEKYIHKINELIRCKIK